jgi:hypothetical protein
MWDWRTSWIRSCVASETINAEPSIARFTQPGRSCGRKMAGVFAAAPGVWGSRRLSVDIARYAA